MILKFKEKKKKNPKPSQIRNLRQFLLKVCTSKIGQVEGNIFNQLTNSRLGKFQSTTYQSINAVDPLKILTVSTWWVVKCN